MKNIIPFIVIISFAIVAVGCGGDAQSTDSPTIEGKTPDEKNPGNNQEAGGAKPVTPL